MRAILGRHVSTIVVALVVSSIASGGMAVAIIANADKVDGYHANQLIRLSTSRTSNNAIIGDGSEQVARQATIVAPKNGFLFIVASSDVFNSVASTSKQCWIALDGAALAASFRQYELSAGNTEENCGTDIAWPVAKGRHTVQFVGDPSPGTIFDETTLEVLFVAFDKKGNVPRPVIPVARSLSGSGEN